MLLLNHFSSHIINLFPTLSLSFLNILSLLISHLTITLQHFSLITTAHPWYGGHSISTNACGVWEARVRVRGARVGVQVSRREVHTHLHLDQAIVEILSCIKNISPSFLHFYFPLLYTLMLQIYNPSIPSTSFYFDSSFSYFIYYKKLLFSLPLNPYFAHTKR